MRFMDETPPDAPVPTSEGDPTGLTRFRRMIWWSSVGLVYALGAFVVVGIAVAEPFGPVSLVGAAGAGIGAWVSGRLLGLRLSGHGDPSVPELPRGPASVGVVAALAVVVVGQWQADPPTWSIIPGVVTGGIAVSVPRRHRMGVVVGGASVAMAVAIATRLLVVGSVDLPETVVDAVLVGMIGLALISALWSWDVVERLDRARRLEARLAVADERLRFAADLHDVQGHHLQVIALESELATRLTESDPEAAGTHMQQVHEQALAALDETRDLVHGYRHTSLGAELANATRVLESAGIDGRLNHGAEEAASSIPEAGRHVLSMVVREATTNVLRHSHAGQARLALEVDPDWARLQIRNDGAGPVTQPPGTGLVTLAERLDSAGGTLDWGRDGKWFTVTARVPAERQSA